MKQVTCIISLRSEFKTWFGVKRDSFPLYMVWYSKLDTYWTNLDKFRQTKTRLKAVRLCKKVEREVLDLKLDFQPKNIFY